MDISSARPAPTGPTPALSAKDVLARVIAARKAAASQATAQARQSPRLAASESAKTQARAKLQQISERIRMKKLFSANPKEMAHALVQVFKELKAAVRAYKAATGEELKLSGDVSAAAIASNPTPPSDKVGAEGDKSKEGDPEASAPTEAAPADTEAARGAALYGAVNQGVREGIGEDGLSFARSVRELANKLSELLETARGQARAAKPNKDTDKALEEADKTLSDLRDDLQDMESDIRTQVPTIGLHLSVAA